MKKRIQVISQSSTELNPIEVAIDEMSKKVSELNQLCTTDEVDMIRLQLKLQGSVSVKVSKRCPELRLTSPVKSAIKRCKNAFFKYIRPKLKLNNLRGGGSCLGHSLWVQSVKMAGT